jgi:hypothetical protein
MVIELSENVIKFPPLPGGKGRGEGERKHTTVRWEVLTFLTREQYEPPYRRLLRFRDSMHKFFRGNFHPAFRSIPAVFPNSR